MSPEIHQSEARTIADATGGLVRRARVLAIVEALAWAVVAGVVSRSIALAGIVGASVAAWRWRRTGAAAIVQAIERVDVSSRNVFVTAHELLSGTLTTSDAVGARVLADAAAVARRVDRAAAAPSAAALRAIAVAALALGVAAMPP